MPPTSIESPDPADSIHKKSVIRYLTVTVLPATIVFGVSVVWALFVGDRLPDEVAIHFSGSLAANGYSSLPVFLSTLAVSFLLVAGLLTFGAVNGLASGWAGRIQGAVTTAILMMLASLVPTLLFPQMDLTAATGVVLPSWSLLVVLGLSVCGLVLGATATPPPTQSSNQSVPTSTEITLSPNERAVWFGAGQVNTAVALVVWAALVVVPVVLFLVASDQGSSLWTIVVLLVTVVSVATLLIAIHVRVDSRGVHWRYFFGLPRGTIRFDDLESAEVVDIRPGEWGGWGWRIGTLGTGLIVRGGEGLRLQRRGKKDLYITVDDAQAGVDLITAFQRRASAGKWEV